MVLELDDLLRIRRLAQAQGLLVGLTNGAFDLLHVGHVDHLLQCKRHCDLLIVAVNSDSSVRRYKSQSRPVLPERERALLVDALACVDHVTIFDDLDACALVQALQPDVYVKDEPYRGRLPEAQYAQRVEFTQGRIQSTTDVIARCAQVHGMEDQPSA